MYMGLTYLDLKFVRLNKSSFFSDTHPITQPYFLKIIYQIEALDEINIEVGFILKIYRKKKVISILYEN